MKHFFVAALAAACLALSTDAETFPLEFKVLQAREALDFPGNYGSYSQLRLVKPKGLKQEPKATSKKPVYGTLNDGVGDSAFVFRLDESQNKKGYDRLIVDINGNGSLLDDPVLEKQSNDREKTGPSQETPVFGPLLVPDKRMIGQWRPQYFAQADIYRDSLKVDEDQAYIGMLRMRAGWYVETTAKVQGIARKVALVDGNGNLRLGDFPKPQTYKSAGETCWYFELGDNFLNDVNGSGKYDRDALATEWCSFSPVVYFGSNPYKLTLSADYKSIGLEPWKESLATISVGPHGDQVANIGFAWETSKDEWRLIRPNVEGGKAIVPAGQYRFYNTALKVQNENTQIMALGSTRELAKPVTFNAGQTQTFECGAPLTIKITAKKETLQPWEKSVENYPGMSKKTDADSKYVLRINAAVKGAGGEIYSSYGAGKDFSRNPPKPHFTIQTEDNQQIAFGNLEFG